MEDHLVYFLAIANAYAAMFRVVFHAVLIVFYLILGSIAHNRKQRWTQLFNFSMAFFFWGLMLVASSKVLGLQSAAVISLYNTVFEAGAAISGAVIGIKIMRCQIGRNTCDEEPSPI